MCVSKPITNCIIEVGVESHDKLYRNPFKKPLKDDELKPYLVKELKSKEETMIESNFIDHDKNTRKNIYQIF